MSQRIYNFNAGPAALPVSVLEEIQQEMLDFHGSGMSVLEVSHRSKWFEEVLDDAIARIKRLLKLDDRYHVLFLQGGASMQFCMVPMESGSGGKTGGLCRYGNVVHQSHPGSSNTGKRRLRGASSEDLEYTYIPEGFDVDAASAYLHITSNNTIRGTQWAKFPPSGKVPMVSDMSSDIFSRAFDPQPSR